MAVKLLRLNYLSSHTMVLVQLRIKILAMFEIFSSQTWVFAQTLRSGALLLY